MGQVIKDMLLRLLTSTKFAVTLASQVVLFIQWFFAKLPAGLSDLALEDAQYTALQDYLTKAVAVVCVWLVTQGMADFGKNAPFIE